MGANQLNWRTGILEKVQERFERYIIAETMQELGKIESDLSLQADKIGDMGDLAAKALEAELGEVKQLQKKMEAFQALGRSNSRMQIAGEAGLSIEVEAGIITLSSGCP